MTEKTDNSDAAGSAAELGSERYIGNLLLPLIVLALVAVGFVQTLEFPQPGEDVGPAGVPYLWMFFAALFCGMLIVQAALKKLPPDPIPGRIGFVVLFAAWLAVYLVAIQGVGYYLSTFVFLLVSMYVLTYRNYAVMMAVTVSWLVFAYVVFDQLLFIQLPKGPLMQLLFG
ncbi:MAG: tripartite tricarboxylate transporter TctB family protein [Hyphomicrobiales bacterium]|nr:tripartite tricarboxylate transporter TctB family protein [Hyphomicrobiales bacterium]